MAVHGLLPSQGVPANSETWSFRLWVTATLRHCRCGRCDVVINVSIPAAELVTPVWYRSITHGLNMCGTLHGGLAVVELPAAPVANRYAPPAASMAYSTGDFTLLGMPAWEPLGHVCTAHMLPLCVTADCSCTVCGCTMSRKCSSRCGLLGWGWS